MVSRDLSSLQKAREVIFTKYQTAMQNLCDDGNAQKANDLWLEIKKLDIEIKNCSFLKKMSLYGC